MRSIVVMVACIALAACKQDTKQETAAAPSASAPASPTASDGVRRVAIEANKDGYTPAKIVGKPGEKLVLVFTRTFDAECIAKLKAPDGALVDLPMNKPVEVAVTVPQSGKMSFACAMDMFHGEVVSQPGA